MDKFKEKNKLEIAVQVATEFPKLDKSQLYNTTSINRGIVKIINCAYTKVWDRQEHAKLDVEHLQELFSLIGLSVYVFQEKGENQTKEAIKNFLKYPDDASIVNLPDMSVWVVIGEGTSEYLLTSKDGIISFDEVKDALLLNDDKPKLIIFDIFRNQDDYDVTLDIKDEHNLLVLHSFTPYHVRKYSFIRHFCKKLMLSAHNQDLVSMIADIFRDLEQKSATFKGTKKLFFNPGIYKDGDVLKSLPCVQNFDKIINTDGTSRLFYKPAENKECLITATQFLFASTINNTLDAENYLKQGGDINVKNGNGWTALHHAAMHGHLEMVKLLIDNNADKYLQTNNGNTALHLAQLQGCEDVCEELLVNETNIDQTYRNTNGETLLHLASQKGQVNIVKFLLSKGAEIKTIDNDDWTALHYAAVNDQVDIIQLLIDRGIDTTALTNRKTSALDFAVVEGHVEVTKLLLKHVKGDLEGTMEKLLHLAIQHGRRAIIEFLCEEQVNVNATNCNGWTALHVAVSRNYMDIVALLLDKGAGRDIRTKNGNSALHIAIQLGLSEICTLLLEGNEDIENEWVILELIAQKGHVHIAKFIITDKNKQMLDKYGRTALHIASCYGQIDMVNYLISLGLDKYKFDKFYFTPLHHAVQKGHLDICKFLVGDSETDIERRFNRFNRVSLLHLAAQKGHMQVVKFLLSKGIEIEARSLKSWTALHYAVFYNHFETVTLLIERGAEEGSRTNKDNTPLHLAVQRGHLEICKELLKSKHPEEYQRKDGVTLLHLASRYNHTEIAKLLCEQGADIEMKSVKGWTALHYAAFHGNLEMIKFLISKNAMLNVSSNQKYTPIFLAVENGFLDICEELLRNENDIDGVYQRPNGKTLLQSAAQRGYFDIVDFLISRNVDINLKNDKGKTALHFAVIHGHIEIVKLLIAKGALNNISDKSNYTPLYYAVKLGKFDFLKEIIKEKLDVSQWKTLFLIAYNNNDIALMDYLTFEANPADDTDVYTIFHYAIRTCNTKLIKYLLKIGHIDKFARDEKNYTVLHHAIINECFEACKLLLPNGTDINKYKLDGLTLLQFAVQNGSLEMVEYFLTLNIDVDERDSSGRTSLHFAVMRDDVLFIRLLKKYNADPYKADQQHRSPLHYAVDNSDVTIYQELK